MRKHTAKRQGLALDSKTFSGASGKSYLVFRTPKGVFYVFVETELKDAARDCGAPEGNSRKLWKDLWDSHHLVKDREPVTPPRKPPSKTGWEQRLKGSAPPLAKA